MRILIFSHTLVPKNIKVQRRAVAREAGGEGGGFQQRFLVGHCKGRVGCQAGNNPPDNKATVIYFG